MEPIIHNAGTLHLPLRSIPIIAVHAPTELSTQHIHQLNTSDDLLSGLIPLAMDHRNHQKYLKMLNIPLLITAYDTVYISRKSITFHPIQITDIKVSNVL